MHFKHLSECSEILTTADERYFFNNSAGEIAVRKADLSASDLLNKLDELEIITRQGIVDTLSTPISEVMRDPVNHLGSRRDEEEFSDELTGRIGSDSKTSNQFKYLYLNGLEGAYRDYLISVGKWPFHKGPKVKDYPKRLRLDRHGTTANDIVNNLSQEEFRAMMTDVLLTKRKPLSTEALRGLEFDFGEIRDKLSRLKSLTTDDLFLSLNKIDSGVNKPKKARGLTPLERTWYTFLIFVAHDYWLMPARLYEQVSNNKFNWLRIPRFTGQMLDIFVPPLKQEELRGVMKSIPLLFKSNDRQIGVRDLYFIFACSNYGTAKQFDDTPLQLIRGGIAGWTIHHNINPYVKGCLEHYGVHGSAADEIRSKLSVRVGARLASDDPFAIYRLPHYEAINLLKAQVSTFEKHTGKSFPEQFPDQLYFWLDEFETRLGKLNVKTYRDYLNSINHWIRYLYILGIAAPKSWRDVRRSKHIHSSDSNVYTIKTYAEKNALETRFLSHLQKLWELWDAEEQSGMSCPFQYKLDWKAPERRGRTHRRSIPDFVVETLIEENARPTPSGEPYAFIREALIDPKQGNLIENKVQNESGHSVLMQFPIQAAIIDCILHLGMRSASARWLDSGQNDGLIVDVETEEYRENTNSPNSKERNGVLQIMQIGRDQTCLSFLMLKNKTMGNHEIPYLPKALARRLAKIRDLQNTYNPIENKIPAVDQDQRNTLTLASNDLEVFPLFRDPRSYEKLPISTDKLHRYWRKLLAHCEPIVHEKRKRICGEKAPFIPFFDISGAPVWDIHSIRVAVVTSLLEQGVPPTIVQLLVGHKSPIMTLHYEAVDNAKTHAAISSALEKRRVDAARKIAALDSPQEIEEAISEILGGLCTPRSGDGAQDRRDLITESIGRFGKLQNVPSAFSVFAHGICPGGECAQGGPRLGSRFTPVHRDKACSRCRFRLTGPAFLAGLTMNANILMSEIMVSIDKVKKLNSEILELENVDMPTAILETRVNQETAFQDELWADWGAEYQTIKECLELERQSGGDSNLPAVQGETGLNIKLTQQHTVSMLHTICKSSKLIAGSSVDVPAGWKARRDEILHDIISNNNVEAHFYKLGKADRERAFDALGDMIQELETASPKEADFIEDLVQGDARLPADILTELTNEKSAVFSEVVNDRGS